MRFQHHLLVIITLCVLCAGIYSNSLDVPFHFDDEPNIVHNRFVQITDLESRSLSDAAFKSPLSSRPLANISFALNHYFSGLDVYTYHIVNILIHLLNGVLVYFLSLCMFRRLCFRGEGELSGLSETTILVAALFSACFFLAHPIQTQSVTYIVQRMNSLAVLFYLLSLCAYIAGRSIENVKIRWLVYFLVPVSWLCAMASKEIAITLPLVIFLYEWFFYQNNDIDWLKKQIPKIVLLVAVMLAGVFIMTGMDPVARIMGGYVHRDFSLMERLMTQPRVIVLYLGLILLPFPYRLNLLHDVSVSHSLLDPATTLVSIVFLLGLFAWAVVYVRKFNLISFCILWFFVHLLTESSIIALEMMFEHRLYLPMVGVAILAGHCFIVLSKRHAALIKVSAAIFIVLLAVGTYKRNEVWTSSESLWRDVISKNQNSHRAYYNFATELQSQGRSEETVAYFRKAIRLKPDYANAHNNLGNAFKRLGNVKEAIQHYQIALKHMPHQFLFHFNLAHAHSIEGDFQAALDEYIRSIQLKQNYPAAHFNVAEIYEIQEMPEKAVEHFLRAVKHDTSLGDAYERVGRIYARQNEIDNAIVYFKKAIQSSPGYLPSYINLAKVYVFKKDLKNACGIYSMLSEYSDASEQFVKQLGKECRRLNYLP